MGGHMTKSKTQGTFLIGVITEKLVVNLSFPLA